MIDWLIQSAIANPDLARGVAPEGLLSASEMRRLAGIKAPKRRNDWLLGRWTAKQLIQSYAERRTGTRIPLDAITIASDPDGAPRVSADCDLDLQPVINRTYAVAHQAGGLEGRVPSGCPSKISSFWPLSGTFVPDSGQKEIYPGAASPPPDPQSVTSAINNLHLSISHSHGHAFCALSDAADAAIGVDIERIEPRAAIFAEDYFTLDEQQQIHAAPPQMRSTLVTLIWSAKEAVLKTLRLGLTVDTRSVSIDLGTCAGSGLAWAPLVVCCSPSPNHAGRLCGWWRVSGEYVLTLALAQAA